MNAIAVVILALFAVLLAFKLMASIFTVAWFALAGLCVGSVARYLLPGAQSLGTLATIGYGVLGSVVGGFVAHRVLHFGWILSFVIEVAVAAALIQFVPKQLPKP